MIPELSKKETISMCYTETVPNQSIPPSPERKKKEKIKRVYGKHSEHCQCLVLEL